MLPCLLSLALVAGDVLTVDDDGPADFSSIAAAVLAAAPGDTLLVSPGTYAAFSVVGKPLSIMGADLESLPRVQGTSHVQAVAATRLVHLELRSLIVTDVTGPVLIVGCTLGQWQPSQNDASLQVQGCDGVLVQYCELQGKPAEASFVDGGPGARVLGSTASFVDCRIEGGGGIDHTSNGGAGLEVVSSRVEAVRCPFIRGGWEGLHVVPNTLSSSAGDGVHASASQVALRGTNQQLVTSGFFEVGTASDDAYSIDAEKGSSVVVGGLFVASEFGHHSQIDASSSLSVLSTAEPFLAFGQTIVPGEQASLAVYGPASEPGLLLISFGANPTYLPPWDGWLWPQDFLLIPLVTVGPVFPPQQLKAPVPHAAGLEGQTIWAQMVFPDLPGTFAFTEGFISNPAALLIRY